MKKMALLGSFALVAAMASTASAGYYPGTYWRCTADYLGGSPNSPMASRQAFGRSTWAKNANTTLTALGNPSTAYRIWQQDWMTAEVTSAAAANVDLYPVYQDPNSASGIWIGPGPNATVPWKGTTYDEIRTRPATLPNPTTSVIALCEPGCYTPEQEIRFHNGFEPIAEAYEADRDELMTLSPKATFGHLDLIQNSVARWTVDIAPAEQTILTFRMRSGGELRVTTEHPILTSEGIMKRATDLVVGESLVREDGTKDPIASVERKTVFTKVYNLRPMTTDLLSNILVAQGYLNGSARYQSEYLKYLNRVLMRKSIPSEIIPRKGAVNSREERGTIPVVAPPAPRESSAALRHK